MDTFSLGRSDPLGLALAIEFPLRLGRITQKPEYDIGDQHPGEIPALAGVQQRHIQHHDGRLLLFCQQPPLFQDFIIISSQPVMFLNTRGSPAFSLYISRR